MMKSKLLSVAVLIALASGSTVNSLFAAAGGANPPRDPNTPGYVAAKPLNPSDADVATLNAVLKSLLADDPAAKAALASASLITNRSLPVPAIPPLHEER